MKKTNIEWTDLTWNPTIGCSKVSPGCEHCYALTMARRLAGSKIKSISDIYLSLTTRQANGKINWTGQVVSESNRLKFKFPMRPTRIFVNSMSDLFHPKVSFNFIDSVYEVMGYHTEHIFQVLTKNPERALEYYNWTNIFKAWDNWDHIWLGTSVENQKYADIRVPILLQIPAKIRWLSCEPLLGNIDLQKIEIGKNPFGSNSEIGTILSQINWVVVGGESGPKTRLMEINWVRNLRDQCVSARVPFFFKQWGMYIHTSQMGEKKLGRYFNNQYRKVSKREGDRVLDGETWDQYPKLSETGRIIK